MIFAENSYNTDYKLLNNNGVTIIQTCQNGTTFGLNTINANLGYDIWGPDFSQG